MSVSAYAVPQRVLLTGASRGIGRATAETLLRHGCRLALVGRDRAALDRVAPAAAGHVAIEADLADPSAAESAAQHALERLGGLDAFVAGAGVAEHAPIGAIDRRALERTFAVNFSAPFLMAQRVGTAMARNGGGAIVLVASTLAVSQAPLTAAYAASKAALVSAMRSLALELGPGGVRVNAVAPGVVDTDMVRAPRPSADGSQPAGTPEERVSAQLAVLRDLHPLGRLGHASEVAETILYLLCAPYVSGALLTLDGGLSLGSGRM